MTASVLPRLRRRLATASRHLAGQRRKLEDTQQLLMDHAAWLEPGDWVPVPAKPGVWHHADATLPPAVVAEGGKAGKKPKSAGRGATPSQRVKKGIITAGLRVQHLLQRSTTRVPTVEPSRGNATVVVRPYAKHGRAELVVLSPGEQAVRLARPGTYHHEYVDARRRFERYLPSPGFAVRDDGAVLVEDWCDGHLLSGLPAERQAAVALEVLEHYAVLTAQETVADQGKVWQALPQLLDEVALPAVLREPLADPRVRRLLTSGLLTPGQGDLLAKNITVAGQGCSWQVVDFDGVGWLPVWWDVVGLAAQFAGGMDDEARRALTVTLDRVWAAAGLDDAAGLSDQHWTALAAVKGPWVRSTQATYLSGNGQLARPDPHDFAQHLHHRAHKVEAQLARH